MTLEQLAQAAAEECCDAPHPMDGREGWIARISLVVIRHFRPLADDLAATRAKLERAVKYTGHEPQCQVKKCSKRGKCDCGYDAVLAENKELLT